MKTDIFCLWFLGVVASVVALGSLLVSAVILSHAEAQSRREET